MTLVELPQLVQLPMQLVRLLELILGVLRIKLRIPEIDLKVDSVSVTAMTKKLKAKWTPELGQDLNAYHNLDAEVELTSILSEQIALEIDREIMEDLSKGPLLLLTTGHARPASVRKQRPRALEVGASICSPDFTGTVSEWYETLLETVNDVSANIHRKTLRGGANFLVCGPEVASILEFTAGFRANVTVDDARGVAGADKVGSLSKKYDVFVDPYFPRNLSWLVVEVTASLRAVMYMLLMCRYKSLLPSLVWKTSYHVRAS